MHTAMWDDMALPWRDDVSLGVIAAHVAVKVHGRGGLSS